MIPSVPQLLDWRPVRIVHAGQDLVVRAEELRAITAELVRMRAQLGRAWTGSAADAALMDVERRTQELERITALTSTAGLALEQAGTSIAQAQAHLRSALVEAAAAGCAVADTGLVTPPAVPVPRTGLAGYVLQTWQQEQDTLEAAQATAAAGIAERVRAALQAANGADLAAQAALEALAVPSISRAARPGLSSLAGRALGWQGRPTQTPPVRSRENELKALLDRYRATRVPPSEYADLLREYWYLVAAREAGVDPNTWIPTRGVDGNRGTIMKVYEYYGHLFRDHPQLQWAGMANLIGPSFAGGFFDLDMVRDAARDVENLPPEVRQVLPPGMGELAHLSDEELGFYETKLLTMQQKIFQDMATQHVAYLHGGLPAVQELRDAGLLDDATVAAWQDIDSGDAAAVTRGNTTLLHREQFTVIAQDYDDMHNHPGTGQAFTYLITTIGAPSIPRAKTFAEVHPLTVKVYESPEIPFVPEVEVQTPLPDGDISRRNQRWDLILKDTLPAYQRLLREDPAGARALTATVASRTEEDRPSRQLDAILLRLLTEWSLKFGVHR